MNEYMMPEPIPDEWLSASRIVVSGELAENDVGVAQKWLNDGSPQEKPSCAKTRFFHLAFQYEQVDFVTDNCEVSLGVGPFFWYIEDEYSPARWCAGIMLWWWGVSIGWENHRLAAHFYKVRM